MKFVLWKQTIFQCLIILLFYFISRVIFTIWNIAHFPELTFDVFIKICIGALRFDFSTYCITNGLYLGLRFLPFYKTSLLKRKIEDILLIGLNSIAFMFEIADWAYFRYNQKRATSDIFKMLYRKADFYNQISEFAFHYLSIILISCLTILLFIFFNKKIIKPIKVQSCSIIQQWVQFFIVSIVVVIGVRGGVQRIPIGIRNAITVAPGIYTPVVLNTPFSIISSLSNQDLTEEIFFDDKTASKMIPSTKSYHHKLFQEKNIVIIILESFSKEFTGISGLKSYTPFLDSLMQKSFVCNNAFANGYRSAEAIPAILAGIPSIQQEPFANSIYSTNRFTSIVNLLQKKGYKSSFYHGGSNGTMSFDIFAKSAGFDKYVGRNEYANDKDFDGTWGVWDEPFLQFCVTDITKNLSQPFIASIFTLSSHPPYKVPNKYKNTLPIGPLEIHQPIAYTDMALKHFFFEAEKQPWYKNTLFVVVADHCSPLSNDDYYHYKQGRFAIPLLYFSPSDTNLKGVTNLLTQQIDILPSVMDYIGFNDSFFALGNSIFSHVNNRFTIQQWSSNLLWTFNDYFLRCNYTIPEGLFDTRKDIFCDHNILHDNDSLSNKVINHLKAFRQVYTQSMIHNKMYIP